jgi:hypothetical protein
VDEYFKSYTQYAIQGDKRDQEQMINSFLESRKQYFLHPCQFLLAKLSFVSNTFCLRNYMKILIFSDSSNFQK